MDVDTRARYLAHRYYFQCQCVVFALDLCLQNRSGTEGEKIMIIEKSAVVWYILCVGDDKCQRQRAYGLIGVSKKIESTLINTS